MTRTCTNCKEEKPLDREHFYTRTTRSGYAWRATCRLCYNASRRDEKRGNTVDTEHPRTLDNAPFVRWITPLVSSFGSVEELAWHVGVDSTGLSRHLDGRYRRVKLDYVDRVFCALDSPAALRELYPELYEFTPKQMAEAEAWCHER